MKRIAIQTEGGDEYGWGHVVRCAHLVPWLKRQYDISTIEFFIDGNTSVNNYLLDTLDDNVDIIDIPTTDEINAFVDSRYSCAYIDLFNVNEGTLQMWNQHSNCVVLFDELRKHPDIADIIVQAQLTTAGDLTNQNYEDTAILRGPEYFAIPVAPSEVAEFRAQNTLDQAPPYKILIMFGGSLYKRANLRVASAISTLQDRLEINPQFILGYEANREVKDAIIDIIPSACVKFGVSRPMKYMRNSHIGILSGGYSKYESAFCGLPTIQISVHDHQDDISQAFADAGAGNYLGSVKTIDEKEIVNSIEKLLMSPEIRHSMQEQGQQLIDGKGIKRIIERVDQKISRDI